MSANKITAAERAKRMFSGIKDAKARQQANYFRPGKYLVRYDAVKVDATRKEEDFLVFECTVIKVMDGDDGKGHKLGESVSHLLMQKQDTFLGNVKRILANVLGITPEAISEEQAISVTSEIQPLAGVVVEIEARHVTTKAGKLFTEVNHKREVPPSELLAVLDANTQTLFFPNNLLVQLAENEARAKAQAAQIAAGVQGAVAPATVQG